MEQINIYEADFHHVWNVKARWKDIIPSWKYTLWLYTILLDISGFYSV